MKSIKDYVCDIRKEIDCATHYSEKYIEKKANKMNDEANRYHEMAEDELLHADTLHMMAKAEVERIKTVFQPTPEMLDRWNEMQQKWNDAHNEYIEKSKWAKQMLNM